MEFSHQIRVSYQETDKMGVVYHSNYLHWFEVGRAEMFRQLEFNYKEIEERGVVLAVVESNCKYHAPAYYDDLIDVYVKVKEFKQTRIAFDYKIVRNEDGKLLTTGNTVHVFVNHNFKPLSLKKTDIELWEMLEENF
ncbi:acyl-CoA thioesterase [Natroniella sp. ANB-PHB2]|uniref:acyl-CoA thioesterase n=1 Tax=Natroniella sp. ANB-PHB2 TaxID=3384444 RepID=UPI0038D422B3